MESPRKADTRQKKRMKMSWKTQLTEWEMDVHVSKRDVLKLDN